MKIIDLLNKIANGEEIPKRIRLADNEYCYEIRDKFGIDYRRINTINHYLSVDIISFIHLNDEVEIIKEETKPITKESIEALGYACGEIQKCFTNGWEKSLKNKPLNEEDKKIEKLDTLNLSLIDANKVEQVYDVTKKEIILDIQTIQHWINKTIDAINEMREDK